MAELAGSLEESADAGADNCSPPNPDEQPPMMTESVVAEADEDIVAQVEGATERVAETLVDAEQQLNAIACAFEAATSELGELADEVADATTAIPAGCTDIPAARPADVEVQTDPAFLAEWDSTPAPVPEQTTSAPAPTPPAASIPPVAVQPASETRPADKAASAGVSANLRFQMQQARANMLVQLDELLVLIERAERMQSDADDSLRRAKEFEQAAARAREAGQVLSAAEAESLKAQSAFEQAQQRAQAARQAWEQAQQQASAAAQTPPGRTP